MIDLREKRQILENGTEAFALCRLNFRIYINILPGDILYDRLSNIPSFDLNHSRLSKSPLPQIDMA